MRFLILAFFPLLLCTGCCICNSTSIRNETGKDIRLITTAGTITIRAHSTGRCNGVWPSMPGQSPASWVISDGQYQFTFADVSPIATMPSEFASSSRFTRNFPCLRITKYVSVESDMTIHAVRVIGYTESEPPLFPLHYTKKEAEK